MTDDQAAMSQVELQGALRAVIRSVSARSASGREAIFCASRHRRRIAARLGFSLCCLSALSLCATSCVFSFSVRCARPPIPSEVEVCLSVLSCLTCCFSRSRAGVARPGPALNLNRTALRSRHAECSGISRSRGCGEREQPSRHMIFLYTRTCVGMAGWRVRVPRPRVRARTPRICSTGGARAAPARDSGRSRTRARARVARAASVQVVLVHHACCLDGVVQADRGG